MVPGLQTVLSDLGNGAKAQADFRFRLRYCAVEHHLR
jgi:hypothetical protein